MIWTVITNANKAYTKMTLMLFVKLVKNFNLLFYQIFDSGFLYTTEATFYFAKSQRPKLWLSFVGAGSPGQNPLATVTRPNAKQRLWRSSFLLLFPLAHGSRSSYWHEGAAAEQRKLKFNAAKEAPDISVGRYTPSWPAGSYGRWGRVRLHWAGLVKIYRSFTV